MKLLFYIIISILIFSCGSKQETTTEVTTDTIVTQLKLTDAQMKTAGVVTATPVIKTMHQTLRANGVVDVPPQNLVSVSFPLGGYLKSTSLLPGTIVRKGQVIAVMEDQAFVQMQQEYLVAKARMEYLSADVQRQRELNAQEATSQKQFQQVTSEYKTQQVLIRSLEEKLKIIGINPARLTVNTISRTVPMRSPINGYVSKVNVNIGKYVNPADVLFELVNPADIHAAINVFEKDLAGIYKGLRGTVMVANDPTQVYHVDVLQVTKNIDETRTGIVHCHFEDKSHDLLPGMFLVANFNVNSQQVYAVPEAAVVRYGGRHYVFIELAPRHFQMKEVVPGTTQDGQTALMDDPALKWNTTKVVVSGAYALLGSLKNRMDED